MTELRTIFCDCCDAKQMLYEEMMPTFTFITNSTFKYMDKPTNLCNDCARIVFDFIKEKRKENKKIDDIKRQE